MSLARDALASGDMIAAESYFQHAEHYNRIIMAAQSQFGPQHGGQPGEGGNGGFRPRWNADGSEDDGDRTTIVPMAAAATFARHAAAAGMTGSARAAAGKTASATLATGSTTAAAAISMDAAVRTAAKGRVGTPTVPIRPTTPPNPTKAPPTPSGSSKLLTASRSISRLKARVDARRSRWLIPALYLR